MAVVKTYNVVVNVKVNTADTAKGNQELKRNLQSYEQEVLNSQRRMRTSEAEHNSMIAQQRRQDSIADFKRQKERYAESKDAERANMAEAQRINNVRNERIRQDNLNAQKQEIADTKNHWRQKLAAHSNAVKEEQSLFELQRKLQASSPFYNSRFQQQTASQSGAFARRTETANFNNQIRQLDPFQNLGARNQTLQQASKDLKAFEAQTKSSTQSMGMWGQAFKGAFIGAIAGMTFATIIGGITGIANKIIELGEAALQTAAKSEMVRNSLTLFSGSARLAGEEMAKIEKLAKDTPGLRLEDAEQGVARLRALRFEATTARNVVEGIAKQKLISGVYDETAVNRVIVNLQQLKAGSPQIQKDIQQMVLAIPSLGVVIEDAFGSINKFKKAIETDSTGALNKFAKAMRDSEIPATGMLTAWEKLGDQFQIIGKHFAEPILDPLTQDIQRLTRYLEENGEGWSSLGEQVADFYRGLSPDAQTDSPSKPKSFFRSMADFTILTPITLAKKAFNDIREKGETERLTEVANRPKLSLADSKRADDQMFSKETKVERAAFWRQQAADEEKAERERIELLKSYYDERVSVIEDGSRRELAILDSQITYTLEQEIDLANKRAEITKDLITQQIAEAKKYYADAQTNEALSATDKIKLELEGNQKIRALNTQLFENELKRKKEVAERERQIDEKRRQAQIEGLNLQTRQINQIYDRRIFDTERAIERESVTAEDGYARLQELTQSRFEYITAFTRSQYDLRLQDLKLTNEERINLEKERDLTLQDLAEENRRKTIELENQKFDAIERRMERNLQYVQDYYSDLIGISSQIADVFFNPSNFSTNSFNAFDSMFTGINAKEQYEIEKKQIADLITKKKELIAEDSKVRGDVANGKSSDIFRANEIKSELQAIDAQFTALSNSSQDLFLIWAKLDDAATDTTKAIGLLGKELTTTLGTYENFDKIAKLSLQERHKLERESLQKEAEMIGRLIQLEKDRAIAEKETDLQFWQKNRSDTLATNANADVSLNDRKITQITADLVEMRKEGFIPTTARTVELEERLRKLGVANKSLGIKQTQEEMDLFRQSIAGLNEEIKLLTDGDISTLNRLFDQFKKDDLTEQKNTLIEIRRLEYDLANPDLNAANEQKLAILQKLLDVRNQESDALTRIKIAEIDLANQGVYSPNQDKANVLEFLAQQKSVTELLSDAKINLITKAYGGLDEVIGRLTKRFGVFGDAIKELLSGLIKLALNKVFQKLFGGNSNGTGISLFGGSGNGIGQTPNFNPFGGGSGGGNFGSNSPTGSILTLPNGQQVFNVNGNSNIPSVQYMSNGAIQYSSLAGSLLKPQMPNGSSTSGASGIGGFAKQLQGMLPMLGLGLGGAIGGGSGAGGILGGIGGGLLGMVGSAFGSSSTAFGGAFGSIGSALGISGAATLGIGAAIGGAILLGSYFLGRSMRRRKEEKIREKAIGDAFRQLDKLIEDVNSDRIDGAGAIEQAESIRQQFIDSANQLKDKKTRTHALKDVSRIDMKIAELKTAVAGQKSRRERVELFAPTFADGGSISGFARNNFRNNPLGYQQGRGTSRSDSMLGYFPRSNSYARFSQSEYVLDAETVSRVGVHNLDLMRQTKGGSFNSMLARTQGRMDGGMIAFTPQATASASPIGVSSNAPVEVHIHVDGTAIGQAIAEAIAIVIKSNDGSNSQMSELKKSIENEGQNGLVQALAEAVKAKLGL